MAQPCILLVDDDKEILGLYRLGFRLRPEWHIFSATDGLSALEEAALHRPNLIILDVMLPDMTGVEVCRQLRAQPCAANTPIVMLSATADPATYKAAHVAGATDFWKKPMSPVELLRRVERLLDTNGSSNGNGTCQVMRGQAN